MRPSTRDNIPANTPNICARCRVGSGSGREYFVDTGMSFEWEGTIYLCNCCLKDIAAAAKEFKTLEEVHDLLSHNNFMASQGATIVKKRAAFYEWVKKTTTLDLTALELRYDENVRLLEDLSGPGISTDDVVKADGFVGTASKADPRTPAKSGNPDYSLRL